ncbi:hypothetical protein SDRG_13871 [Saprolegnia diclina VS20]|uniref:Transmembrane protein n=1 Tax=Saprolegnia diclina (strain VS20) TaxID=1156394 RepID=T0R8C4_SAPDV|nr:hypothetical protein SDRG_13871 [Saprolegnia diclina VS20]EQC28323.1 hypothetical protein SDRG_13871 [Saprolegnia diclina VS20]|eukprot:XP_008618193.1 hypothetical protein SDRG_13871 [Saprolegnia diclina VS20]
MGQATSKPVGERRAFIESLALLVSYTVYTAFSYYVTFTWLVPLVDGMFGDVFILGALCRGYSTVVYFAYLGVLLPYVATVVFNKDECFYRIPTSMVSGHGSNDTTTWLITLPWLVVWVAFFILGCVVAPEKGRAIQVTAAVPKPPTPVKPVALPPPRPIPPPAQMQEKKMSLGERILSALLSPLLNAFVSGVLKDMEKRSLKANADRAASSRGATSATVEPPVPTPKAKEPKKPLRKRVLSWFKSSSKRSQPSGEKATTK